MLLSGNETRMDMRWHQESTVDGPFQRPSTGACPEVRL